MPIASAGLLMFRRNPSLEVFLVHPGGPFFRNKDSGAWTIPKGLPNAAEQLEAAARREFEEETGIVVSGALFALGSVRQKGGKEVHAWAFENDVPAGFTLVSNRFELEWPPRSGKKQSFPEVDRAEFFGLQTAREKINPAQTAFLDRLVESLSV